MNAATASQKVTVVFALALVGLISPSVKADITSLDTANGSGWQVQRIPIGGESDPTAYSGPVIETAKTPGNGGTPGTGTWILFNSPTRTPYDPNAKWVSWTSRGGNSRFEPDGYFSDADGTKYTYTRTFTLGSPGIGEQLDLAGYVAADNYVSAVTLTTGAIDIPVSVSRGLGPDATGYYSPIFLNSSYLFTGIAQFQLKFFVVNSGSSGAGPTGLLFSGTATSTPEPTSMCGLAIGGICLLTRPHRRRRNSV